MVDKIPVFVQKPHEPADDNISLQDVEARKQWQEISADDEALIDEIRLLLAGKIDSLIDTMYSHFLSFPHTRKFFPDEETLKRAQTAQAQYFLRLTQGNYDEQYVKERLRVGKTHYRIGLDPQWYLGAYRVVLSWYRRQLSEIFPQDSKKTYALINALTKVIFFDMSLALDAYFNAKEESIREQRDSIAELETGRRVTKSILENAPVGIVHLDLNFNCVECNSEFLEIAELDDRNTVIGNNLFSLIPHLPVVPFEQVLISGQPFRKAAAPLNLSHDGNPAVTYWDWAIWPINAASGLPSGLVVQFVSATDRVLLQQQREDFVATLTHDLKTPILAANRAIKLLLEGDFGAVSKEQAEILQTIHVSNESLYQLVQTLLDVYRYESGVIQLAIQPHNLARVISNLAEEFMPLAKAKNVKLNINVNDSANEVYCDASELKRVVQNLLDNALKYTPSEGSITVDLEQNSEGTQVSVIDTGKGISEDDKPKLFQRFWQAASSGGRYYASTGLGLYLCRKIITMHGGRIWCDSKLGQGSTFAFTIPKDGRSDA